MDSSAQLWATLNLARTVGQGTVEASEALVVEGLDEALVVAPRLGREVADELHGLSEVTLSLLYFRNRFGPT